MSGGCSWLGILRGWELKPGLLHATHVLSLLRSLSNPKKVHFYKLNFSFFLFKLFFFFGGRGDVTAGSVQDLLLAFIQGSFLVVFGAPYRWWGSNPGVTRKAGVLPTRISL